MRNVGLVLALLGVIVGCGDDDTPPPGGDAGACEVAADCDDGVFCNGPEQCAAGRCVSGLPPCDDTETCVESTATCEAAGCDEDGDGHESTACGGSDCDDTDPARFPGAVELCDAEGRDEDCDSTTLGDDRDGDGFVSDMCCNGDRCGLDCDDTRPGAFPDSTETCNGADEDCDGEVDEGVLRAFYPDEDGDGFGDASATPVMACTPPTPDHVEDNRDCDDDEILANPGTSEGCDGIDNDCDGEADEAGLVRWYRDADGDDFGDPDDFVDIEGCAEQPGRVLSGTDCNDDEETTHPGAAERCDRIDSDCSFITDRGGIDPGEDMDEDGHAPLTAICEGGLPVDDCDDDDATVFPGATETCSGSDQDCDGTVDEGGAALCGGGMTCDGVCTSVRAISGWNGGETFIPPPDIFSSGEEIENDAWRICALRDGVPHCFGIPCDDGADPEGRCSASSAAVGEDPLSGVAVTGFPGDATELATGRHHLCVRIGGQVHCEGNNDRGQLGDATTSPRTAPVRVMLPADDAVALAAGDDFTCAVRRAGSVWCWGDGARMALGSGAVSAPTPIEVPGLDDALDLVAGRKHVCVRRRGGEVTCWGDNRHGEIDTTPSPSELPTELAFTDVRAIGAGPSGTCVVTARGELRCLGELAGDDPTPVRATPLAPLDMLALGRQTLVGRRLDGTLEVLGRQSSGGWATGRYQSLQDMADPGEIAQHAITEAGLAGAQIATSRNVHCVRDGSEEVRCWGPVRGRFRGFQRSAHAGFVELTSGFATCGRTSGGEVSCWGDWGGQVHTRPVVLVSDATQIAGAESAHCALREGGAVECWGTGPLTPAGRSSSETAVATGITDGVHIAVAQRNLCVVRTGSVVTCWGNYFGGALTPIAFPAGFVPETLTVGDIYGCARGADGTVACWGNVGMAPSGADDTNAVRVPGITTASSIVGSRGHTCALLADGTARCWGLGNFFGKLGDGTRDDAFADMPTTVVGLSDGVQLSATTNATCALTDSMSTICWGAFAEWTARPMTQFRLGDLTPTDITHSTPLTTIVAGSEGMAGLDGTGRSYFLGNNAKHNLGHGTSWPLSFP